MKNILRDFYNININYYEEHNNGIYFYIGGDCYYFFSVGNNDFDFIDKVNEYVKRIYRLKMHTFVKNKNNEFISDGFVLMKVNVLISEVDIGDIKRFSNCTMNDFKSDYINLIETWYSKLDYYNEKIKENIFISIRYICDYYICVAEMLLKFIGDIEFSSMDLFLSHKKDYNNTLDYYNPFNLTVDVIPFDLVRYFDKENMINGISGYYMDNERRYLFFKLVFPYDFFDLLEECINSMDVIKIGNIDISSYEERFDKYQELFNYYLLPIKKSN